MAVQSHSYWILFSNHAVLNKPVMKGLCGSWPAFFVLSFLSRDMMLDQKEEKDESSPHWL